MGRQSCQSQIGQLQASLDGLRNADPGAPPSSFLGRMRHSTIATSIHHCVSATDPAESGAAAIATIAHFHGCELQPGHLKSIVGVETLRYDLLLVLMAARRCGFNAVPLEGCFDELPEVSRPNIVVLSNEAGQEQFAVLFEIDADSVVLGDTTTGKVAKVSREHFCQRWTGDAVQMEAVKEELESLSSWLHELDSPWLRLRRALTLEPPFLPKIWFLIATVVVLALFAVHAATGSSGAQELGVLAAIASCLLCSMWLGAFSSSCPDCAVAAQLVGGIPLARIGTFYYFALLIGALAFFGHPFLTLALAAASGSHLVLVALLFKERVLCPACGLTALSALVALGITVTTVDPHVVWVVLTIALTATVTALVIPMVRHRYQVVSRAAALALASAVLGEEERPLSGRVRIVVYKQKNCHVCAYVESVVGPALVQDFGDVLDFEERWVTAEKTSVPLIIVQGSSDFVFVGISMVSGYQRLQMAIGLARNPELAGLAALGGMTVVGAGN